MEAIKNLIENVFGASAVAAGIFLMFCWSVGTLYWVWMAIKIGSFWMFVIGIAGPLIVFTGPIGAYSLFFGIPDWIWNTFG